jgi:putative hydrolase of the HAD superfamily
MKLPWNHIETVLLDMDGTLLDLRFDNHFWLEHMPRRYSEVRCIAFHQARMELLARYRRVEGTLSWYCVDYWSRELGFNVGDLKHEVSHLIALQPGALDFLKAIRNTGKRAVLVTNAHPKSLRIKLDKTGLAQHLDAVITAHQLGLPKEEPQFWHLLQAVEPFQSTVTCFMDDNPAILRIAHGYGIQHIVAMGKPDSAYPANVSKDFPSITDFSELLPLS